MPRRVFVTPERLALAPGPLFLSGADFRYVARVLRLGAGDELVLFDGRGREARARVERVEVEAARVLLVVEAPAEATREPARLPITCVVGLLKGEKMDLVVQKATELGVGRIVPAQTARSVVRLDAARAATRLARWRKIAREAARQCGRADAPELDAIAPLEDVLAAAPPEAWRAIFHEGPEAVPLRGSLPPARPPAAVIAIGPEGGFEPGEIEAAQRAGFRVVGFGPRVLRAETAALAALAVIGFALGDLG